MQKHFTVLWIPVITYIQSCYAKLFPMAKPLHIVWFQKIILVLWFFLKKKKYGAMQTWYRHEDIAYRAKTEKVVVFLSNYNL